MDLCSIDFGKLRHGVAQPHEDQRVADGRVNADVVVLVFNAQEIAPQMKRELIEEACRGPPRLYDGFDVGSRLDLCYNQVMMVINRRTTAH